jgi:hypothetical protein
MHKITKELQNRWSTEYYTFHHKPDQPIKFGIFAVGPGGDAQIKTYIRDMGLVKSIKEGQEWHGIETIAPDIVLCAEREILITGRTTRT